MENILSFRNAFFISVLILVYRLYLIYTSQLDLTFDEAQYWFWSKDLDWGYFSKPPMVAWLIAAVQPVCGDTAFCTRLPAPIIHFLTSIVVYGLARKLFDAPVAFWSCLIYLTIPGTTLSSVLITSDVMLMFCWACAMFSLWRALEEDIDFWWIATGVFIGLGCLSKYTMLIFIPSAMLYMFINKEDRKWLIDFKWFGALFTALIVFFPNLLWNARHGFVTVRHTSDNIDMAAKVDRIDVNSMLEFLGSQLGVAGPVLFLCLLWIFVQTKLFKETESKYLSCFILPLLFVALGISAFSGANAHWAAPIYIPSIILVCYWIFRYNRITILKAIMVVNIIALVGLYHHKSVAEYFNVELNATLDPTTRLRTWHALPSYVYPVLKQYPRVPILTDERKIASTLTYMLRARNGQPYLVYKWNGNGRIDDHYDIVRDPAHLKGYSFIFVTRDPQPKEVLSRFEKTYNLQDVKVSLYRDHRKMFYIYYLYKFKGYN